MPEKRSFPTNAVDYELMEEIGHGAFAIVYRALCKPLDLIVAVKQMDLEACNSDLESVCKEAQMMSLIDHPNVMKAYCSFNVDQYLWVIMPYMDGGSCLHIMKIRFPDGLEESAIAVILKETLKGLDYLHQQQQIHRDIKAGNILIDSTGAVKLGDFGTSAYMFGRGGERVRKTFTGTPCWMAPEVMEQKHGYDFRADIWSFGITALELAHGHAPFSKYPPMKILLMTIKSAPPSLDKESDKRFSKAFREVVRLCLNKDPSKRPTTEKLLKHSFFKHTKSDSSITQRLLTGLGPLWERENYLREKDAALLASKKPAYFDEEERSRNEYKRGVSSWNFDVESLKDQAAMIQDEDDDEESTSTTSSVKDIDDSVVINQVSSPPARNLKQLSLNTAEIGRRVFPSEKKEPKQIGRFGVFDGDLELESPGWHEIVRQTKYVENQFHGEKLPTIAENKSSNDLYAPLPAGEQQDPESDVVDGNVSTSDNIMSDPSSRLECFEHQSSNFPSSSEGVEERPSSSLLIKNSSSATAALNTAFVEMVSDPSSVPSSILAPQLKSLLVQTAKQYEALADMLKLVNQSEGMGAPDSSSILERKDGLHMDEQSRIYVLENQVASLTKELIDLKFRNVQLEQQLNAIYNRQEEERIRREEAEKYK